MSLLWTYRRLTESLSKMWFQIFRWFWNRNTADRNCSEKDVSRRKYLGGLIDSGIFERIAVISDRKGPGTVEKVIAEGRVVYHV